MATLTANRVPTALHVTLWIGQAALAAMFAMAGAQKLVNTAQFPFPAAFTLFLGVAEVAGAVGVVVPALTRIKPVLTPVAAGALGLVMILATAFHLSRGEPVGLTAGLALVAAFVAWGRAGRAAIRPR